MMTVNGFRTLRYFLIIKNIKHQKHSIKNNPSQDYNNHHSSPLHFIIYDTMNTLKPLQSDGKSGQFNNFCSLIDKRVSATRKRTLEPS